MSQNKQNVINDIQTGDIFSEISHYKVMSKGKDNVTLQHTESGENVTLSNKYIQDLLSSADQFFEEKTVGKEDKQDGTPGIRTIWEGIHSSEVFAVSFRKQDTALSSTKLASMKQTQLTTALQEIENAAKNKKGVAAIAKTVLARIQDNPIVPIEPGEMRVLRGYKTQYDSRDGKYNCVDMNLLESNSTDTSKAIRPVNINTINWLVFKGVKYTVKA